MKDDWVYRRGDIYLADLNPYFGSKQGGIRPVLVLQNNTGNFYCPTLIAAPLTARRSKKPNQPTHYHLKGVRGMDSPSVILLGQIRTIDKRRKLAEENLNAGWVIINGNRIQIKALSVMERSTKISEKRQDSKNRILRSDESQRKDGRYAFKYTDAFGKPQFVYAWKLVPTDTTPAGKRDDISLREKIKEILKDLDDGIDTVGKKMTVCQHRQREDVRR